MNKELKQEFERLHKRLGHIETEVRSIRMDVSSVQSDVKTLKTDVSSVQSDVQTLKTDVSSLRSGMTVMQRDLSELQYNMALQFRAVRQDIAQLLKNLDPLGYPNEAADLYGRVKYLEMKLGIESGK
jgi:mediator of RNA polymerase II transcription subunit 25